MKKSMKILLFFLLAFSMVITSCGAKDTGVVPTQDASLNREFDKVVSATGVVNPDNKATLSVSTAGIVEEVLVEKGDMVTEGQTLIRLKGKEEIQASIAQAKFEVLSAQQAMNDLYDNLDVSRATSLREVAEASNAVHDAKYNLDNFTIPMAQQGLDTIAAMELMRKKLDETWDAFEPYKNESYLNDTRKDLKDDLDIAQADYNAAIKRVTYEFELADADARLSKALKDYEAQKGGPDPEQLALAESRLENSKAALAAAESLLDDLEIKAQFDSTVSEIYLHEGEWVSPGQPIVLIADLKHLRIETTDLNEIDVAQVAIGDTASITFDALPGVEITGKVVKIAPKASEGSGVNYTVWIDISSIPENLRWGMTAFVDILINQ
jgi:multidrug efflux pump subunit AcrA (membrane-fusion protein)